MNIRLIPLDDLPPEWSTDRLENELIAEGPGVQVVRDTEEGTLFVIREGELDCRYEPAGFAAADGPAMAEDVDADVRYEAEEDEEG